MVTPLPISLVTCSYQQGRYIGATISSVVAQDYPRLEYIVIDGGSNDDSVNIIKSYERSLAYWVSEPDRGQTDALIKGFCRATGEIQGWLCSDDLLLPGALEAINGFFQNNPEVNAVYGDALWIDGEGKFIRPKKEIKFNRFVFLYDHNYVPQPSMFWRSSLYNAVGGLDSRLNLAMDSDLWERFSARTKIAHLPRYLSCMRYYPDQKTRSMRQEGRREDSLVRYRKKPQRSQRLAYPLLHVLARCMRISSKALTGGYRATVLPEHLRWLKQHASRGSA